MYACVARRQDELEAKLIEEETAKRVEELVAMKVAQELEKRKDEIEAEVRFTGQGFPTHWPNYPFATVSFTLATMDRVAYKYPIYVQPAFNISSDWQYLIEMAKILLSFCKLREPLGLCVACVARLFIGA